MNLRRIVRGTMLLRELRGFRQELQGLRAAVERIAHALEERNAHDFPVRLQPDPDVPAVEVSYVDTAEQQELLDIEMGLTVARGMPPSEEDVLQEFERRRAIAQGPPA